MFRRLLALTRAARLPLLLTVLAGLLSGLLIILQARALSDVVAAVFLGDADLREVIPGLTLLLVAILGRALLTWLGEASAGTLAVRIKDGLRTRLLEHLAALGPAFARGERTGELSAAAVEGVEALDAWYSQYLPQLFLAALVPLTIFGFVLPRDPLSALVLALTAPLIPFFMILIGRSAESLTRRQWQGLGRLSAHFLDSLQGLTTLKLFGQSRAHLETIRKAAGAFRDATLRVLRVTFLSALALELIATISTAVIAVEIGLRLLYGRLDFATALFLLVLAPEFYQPLRTLGLRFHAGMAGSAAAERIFSILDIPAPKAPTHPQSAPADPGEIAFHGVSYRYPASPGDDGETRNALTDLTLTIPAGQHTALVGATGAGKSTLVSLLLRFAEPTAGRISVDGVPLTGSDPGDWRARVAWVPQRPHLFHGTIQANLRIARPDASWEQVHAAVRMAGLEEFIQSLPEGYETMIGEQGARLSAGQAQRLAIARAFLKDAPILILDEPTSSLDPANEALIARALGELMRGRTVLTIAHRLNTVRHADHILVLDSGRLAEQGTHAELLAADGAYAALVRAGLGAGLPAGKSGAQAVEPGRMARGFVQTSLGGAPLPPTGTAPVRSALPRLLAFVRGAGRGVALSVLLGSLTVLAGMGLLGTSAWLISAAALGPSIAELQVAIVGVRFFGIARAVFRYLERLATHNVTFGLLARIRAWFYEKLEPLAPARLQQLRSGDLLTRAVADVETLEHFYARVVAPPLVAALTGGLAAFLLGSFDPLLGLAVGGLLLAHGVGLPLLNAWLGRAPGRRLVELRAELQGGLVDAVQGLADLLAFGRARENFEALSTLGRQAGRQQRRMAALTGLGSGLGLLLSNLALWLALWLAIPLIRAGGLDGVLLAALALLALTAFESVAPLPLAAQLLGGTTAAAGRLFAVVDAEPAVIDPPAPSSLGNGGQSPDLRIRGLRFRYESSDPPALDGLDLDLPAGGRLAVVGPSGAGKSTLVSLLLRFWEYSEGEILLDGRDLREYSGADVRAQIAVVGQNAYLFNATVRQNLRLARPAATDAEIESAARRAQIHDFIQSLPQGYDTWIGEQGLRLSGGERQRLAVARALLKDASILILDEPTANLDALTARALMDDILANVEGKSILLITHRLVGLERFDQVIVLETGRIVEKGGVAELLAGNGPFKQMIDLQTPGRSA